MSVVQRVDQDTLARAATLTRNRLWTPEPEKNAPYRLSEDFLGAVAAGRLYSALRARRLAAYDGPKPIDDQALLTDKWFRESLLGLNDATVVRVQLQKWLNRQRPLTIPPNTPYIGLVEAVSYLSFDAFLVSDDFAASLLVQPWKEDTDVPERDDLDEVWRHATDRLLTAAVNGALPLLGRYIEHFGQRGDADLNPVPFEYLAGAPSATLSGDLVDAKRASRGGWSDVRVDGATFRNAFFTPQGSPVDMQTATSARRKPMPSDERDIIKWAKAKQAETGAPPSIEQTKAWARDRGLSRDWARKMRREEFVDAGLTRPSGGRGSAKYLDARRPAESTPHNQLKIRRFE